jgi:RNA polymerase sigma factor (sigma-70 family)
MIDIIQRSQQGDTEAFAALYDRYKNLVYKTAYLMNHDSQEAEDSLQEVFMLVYKALPNFDPAKGAFTTWLYRITMNHCLNQRRKYRPPQQSLDDDALDIAAEPSTTNTNPLETEAVRQAIAALSDKLRAVVILRYYGDLPYAEIAEALNIPLGTVKSRLDLALRTLNQRLNLEVSDISTLKEGQE